LICEELDKAHFDKVLVALSVSAIQYPEIEQIYQHLREQKPTDNARQNCQALLQQLRLMVTTRPA
jgi:2-methylisocitrate lyase-like PEP mutase family enzyme